MAATVESLNAILGKRVRVTTILPQSVTVEGDLFAVDTRRGWAVLRRQHAHTYLKADYLVAVIRNISAIEVLGEGESSSSSVKPIGRNEVEKRYAEEAKKEERALARRGIWVSETAQKLCDLLAKNFPLIRWEGTTIVLDDMGATLREPYGLKELSIPPHMAGNDKYVERVRTVVGKARVAVGLAEE